MRVDIVTIFPEYLTPLDLSLVGKAREAGLIQIAVHDLREWTHDRHKSVDDTPYGGGAGMVMTPVIWGRALDQLLDDDAARSPAGAARCPDQGGQGQPDRAASSCVIVIPSPSGEAFTQSEAQRLTEADQVIIACGRYEGIDARVAQHYASRPGVELRELSIGDYVLAGGEAAALVMVEAVARLIPGVLGNTESLVEESHADAGLLEYPTYTKPPQWRGLDVPPILLSGNHAHIRAWRRAQAIRLTARRRPDLIDRAERAGGLTRADRDELDGA